jgi:hypothetical protein
MSLVKSAGILLSFVVVTISASSAGAVTCEDVRRLSRAEQEYWSKRLNLTAQQRHQIWQACYGGGSRHRHADLPAQL